MTDFLQNRAAMQNEGFWRWLKTAAVLLAMMNAGLNLGIFSPTFPDMALLTSVTNGQMATTMTWVGLASIVGALCMGPLFDRFDGLFVLACALLFQGLAIGVAPWCRILIVFQIMAGVSSIFSTGIMTGSLTVNCIIWKKRPEMISPIIQVTDLFHAFGTALTPQLIAPFIGKHQSPDIVSPTTTPHGSNVSSSFENFDLYTVANDSTRSNSTGRYEGPEPVQLAYVLVAVLDIVTAVVCFVICAADRGQTRAKSYEHRANRIVRSRSYSLNEDGRTIIDEEFTDEPPRDRTASLVKVILQKNFEDDRTRSCEKAKPDMRKLVLKRQELQQRKENRTRNDENIAEAASVNPHGHADIGHTVPPVTCNSNITPLVTIVILFFIVNGGRDTMFTGLLYTFLNGYLDWSPRAGMLMVTFYHVTRVVIHIAFVLLARCLSPVVLIVADIVFLVVSSSMMLVTVNASPVFTVLAVILTGFATSNLHPTAITLAQRCFQVDGKVMGVLIGMIFFGTSAVSPIVGMLLDTYGAISFPVVLLSITGGGIVLFALWLVVARVVRNRQGGPPVEEILIKNEKTPLIDP